MKTTLTSRRAMLLGVGTALLGAVTLPAQAQQQIYGSELMTRRERIEYRQRLRAAHSATERERIRAEHHRQMQQRARERGFKLPDTPPPRGAGMGPGGGGGMGPGGGGGMGPGGGGGMGPGGGGGFGPGGGRR